MIVRYSSVLFTDFSLSRRKGNIAPGGELKTIEDYISLGVPRDIAEMKHPLENAWSFWYFRNDKNRSWEENQINLATVDTIEDFWQLYNYVEPASKLGVGCDYALFKVKFWLFSYRHLVYLRKGSCPTGRITRTSGEEGGS